MKSVINSQALTNKARHDIVLTVSAVNYDIVNLIVQINP
jgi:hypothetical protein